MEQEKARSQNLSRKMVATMLQEGIRNKFQQATHSQAASMGMPYGGLGTGAHVAGDQSWAGQQADPYATLQPKGSNLAA